MHMNEYILNSLANGEGGAAERESKETERSRNIYILTLVFWRVSKRRKTFSYCFSFFAVYAPPREKKNIVPSRLTQATTTMRTHFIAAACRKRGICHVAVSARTKGSLLKSGVGNVAFIHPKMISSKPLFAVDAPHGKHDHGDLVSLWLILL